MEDELFRAILVTAGFCIIINYLGVWMTGALGLCFALFGCGSEETTKNAQNGSTIEQLSLTTSDEEEAHDQCVMGQSARINQGYATCIAFGIRSEEYCQTCKDNEWANVESTFDDIEADAKAQYMACIVDPATKQGFFSADFCVSLYHNVVQQRMTECERSLYCFTI